MAFPFKDFVDAGGAALQAEEQRITATGQTQGHPGGLLQQQAERFYRDIAWKAACTKWPSIMGGKLAGIAHDLVIYDRNNKGICAMEMKTWFDPRDIPARKVRAMKADILKLQNCGAPDSAFVIFSASLKGAIDVQLGTVERQVFSPGLSHSPEVSRFDTLIPYEPSANYEFWIAAWPIKSSLNPSAEITLPRSTT